jgi:nitrite reductase/ring-hydroxylating ferredoxin subunit
MEAKVVRMDDLQDGEMREVVVGKTKVLLVRLKGKFYAIGGECTHYGGPLAEGALSGHLVTCPWHQAVFDVMNGDLEEPPALDAEPCFTVRVEGEDVFVKVPEKNADRRTPAMVRRDPADGHILMILDQQVEHHLLQLTRVSFHRGQIRGQLPGDADPAPGTAKQPGGLIYKGIEIDGFGRQDAASAQG